MTSRCFQPLTLALLTLAACTHGAKSTKEPVQPETMPAGDEAEAAGTAAPGATPAPAATAPTTPDPCVALDKMPGDPPVYVPEKNVVLTRVLKPCVTRDGRKGAEKDTQWLAMGFPCTGGAGRIDIKGNYNNPKMVSFILGTDCGMEPASKEAVKKAVTDAIGLPPESRLMAYTPFVLQYWEIPGMEDADTGFTIDLRTAPAVEGLWSKFKKSEPVPVRLFGRENAWGQGDNVYFVEGELRMAGRTSFTLDVARAKSLTAEELAEVKTRCESLRPRRNCSEVF